jgi:4-hydroxybenzoate polyprenyltransferase
VTFATREAPVTVAIVGWVVLAFTCARWVAMAVNRIVDREYDARNPRTAQREIPRGVIGVREAWVTVVIAAGLFLWASAQLNPLCAKLAPVALAWVCFYSFTKRFTSMSHLVLGFALGIAPAAAWIAVTGSLDGRILWLTAAVTFWTAGFDIIYACQDYEFDRREGLFSLPSRFGIAGALWIARLLHAAMLLCLGVLLRSFDLGWLSLAGTFAVAMLLVWEHSLVKPHDLSRVDAAFFNVNGYIGVLFFVFWAADVFFLHRGA